MSVSNPQSWQHQETSELQAQALEDIIRVYNITDGGFRDEYFPDHTRDALTGCVEHGYEPGSFLKSVLDNDLVRAAGRADEDNRRNLAFIAHVIEWVGFREWYAQNQSAHKADSGTDYIAYVMNR